MSPYVREAYNNRKFAFVSDVARLYALVSEGGVYLDTDVELLASPESILKNHRAVMGFETATLIQTAFMASEAGHHFFKEWLELYENIPFVLPDGSFDMTTNVERISRILLRKGLVFNDEIQEVADVLIVPSRYACPYNNITHEVRITPETFCFHHFAGTWLEGKAKRKHAMHQFLGHRVMRVLLAIKRCLTAKSK